MLVTLPGVTADSATGRGLGISVNGQRAFSSNYLLDGVENNDTLLTGPLTVIAPEAVEEYRVSTNNFTSEFGRTGGFVANVVTRGGTNDLHGVLYGYLNDASLNANSYQHKAGLNTSTSVLSGMTVPRQGGRDSRTGFWTGGPVRRDRLFWSGAYEGFRSRAHADPFPYAIPVLAQFQKCNARPEAIRLLQEFRPSISLGGIELPSGCSQLAVPVSIQAPIDSDRRLGLFRLDTNTGDRKQYRWMLRGAVSRFDEPYFSYSVYPGLSSALFVNSTSLAAGHTWVASPSATNEIRLAYRNTGQGWNRPTQAPALSTAIDGSTLYPYGVSLPSSDLRSSFRYSANAGEVNDVFSINRGRVLASFGGGLLLNRSSSALPLLADGIYMFSSLNTFAADRPNSLQIAVPRAGLPTASLLGFERDFRNQQFYGFAQATIRASTRGGLNLGLRYESYGAPRNTGSPDAYLSPGSGATIEERLKNATLQLDQGGQRSLYAPDRNNFAGQLGAFYDLSGHGQTVIRAAYGIFYDRPSENLTSPPRSNNFQTGSVSLPAYPGDPHAAAYGATTLASPYLVWIDQGLRTPYVQSWFGGVQQQIGRDLYVELSAQGALGRKLISSDIVNRLPAGVSTDQGRLNQEIDTEILFRSNAGSSNYSALTALARYRGRRSYFQGAYTWGHSIDNQSDPLTGTFGDLQLAQTNANATNGLATFSRQFDSRLDRGSSDFDQRHNLVVYGVQEIGLQPTPGWRGIILSDWQVSSIAGFRSGFPIDLTVGSGLSECPGTGAGSAYEIFRRRPSLVPGKSPYLAQRMAVPGGFILLDASAFCDPGYSQEGNLGRNSLVGPGFWNADLSLAKSVRFGERTKLQFRADFFNVFNHANLGSPYTLASVGSSSCAVGGFTIVPCGTSQTFGQALLGRQGVQPSFPSLTPLDQLARQIQLQLKLTF
jgi:hypothetical protein